MLIGLTGLACSGVNSPLRRARICSVAVGLLCGLNCLAVYGIAFYWTGAASKQSAILRTVEADVRSLPSGSALLLDGFCRHFGPAVVFEAEWDTSGAVQLALHDPSLTADVVSPSLRLLDSAVTTTAYGDPDGSYPYGDRIFVFNVRGQTLTPLRSLQSARAYFQAINPTLDSGCPASRDGRGVKVF